MPDDRLNDNLIGNTALAERLAEMNVQGGFVASVLSDRQGFLIAAAVAAGHDPDVQSAVVAQVQNAISHVRGQLGMGQTDEIAVADSSGRRLVCRLFRAGDQELILAVLVPTRASYRRLTNRAIRDIRSMLS